ncbi:CHAT domain-containing protein [Streptomyces sp. NPDC001922]|uniref:CHAT domain-containing protein n=1 Tax=Streptomyces sp. NPDC001922 TaxID=3364624 RepID=UPI00367C962E
MTAAAAGGTCPAGDRAGAVLSIQALDDTPGSPLEVRLRAADGTEARHTVTAGAADLLEGPADRCPARLDGLFDPGVRESEREAAGELMYGALFDGPVAELWDGLRPRPGARTPLRVRLEIGPARLRVVPWELLRRGPQWLWQDDRLRLLRHAGAEAAADTRDCRGEGECPVCPGEAELGPLRILVVVCNPRDRTLLADEEVASIRGAFADRPGRCDVEVLDGPSKAGLSRAIERLRPHVLHFIGHGMPRGEAGSAALVFNWASVQDAFAPSGVPGSGPPPAGGAAAAGPGWELDSTGVTELASWRPGLVVLNACRSAEDPADRLGGLADAFLRTGSRAVISMQADVRSRVAVTFSAELYRRLGAQEPLEDALAATRRRLRTEPTADGSWALPVLTTVCGPQLAVPVRFALADESLTDVLLNKQYADLRLFLGRSAERRIAWWSVDGDGRDRRGSRLLVLTGETHYFPEYRIGKTWLAHWWLLTCALRGERATYVDLAARDLPRPGPGSPQRRSTHKDWLDTVRVVREACLDPVQLTPMPEAVFADSYEPFNRAVRGLPPSSAEPVSATVDEWLPFDENSSRPDARRAEIFAGLLGVLRASAQEQPHVIVMDNADLILPEAFEQFVYPLLLRPVALDRGGALRFVLVADPNWVHRSLPAEDEMLRQQVSLEDFDAGEFHRLAREHCLRSGLQFEWFEQVFEAARGKFCNGPVPVGLFGKLCRIFPPAQLKGARMSEEVP